MLCLSENGPDLEQIAASICNILMYDSFIYIMN